MTLNEYQTLAARTIRGDLTLQQSRRHALFGLTAEVGELLSLYQKEMQGHEISMEHAEKECGDILWMLAEYCTASRIDLDDIAVMNIEKLKKRYPDGFDIEKSLHRKGGDI